MTSPSSYVFYDEHNPLGTRAEGTELTRVFVTEDKMTIYRKKIIKTAKSGVLFEKVLSQRTLSVVNNSKGERYLKMFDKSPLGNIKDTSFMYVIGRSAGSWLTFSHNRKVQQLVETIIINWFDYDHPDAMQEHCNSLFFPALRDAQFPFLAIKHSLERLQEINPAVTQALRENSSWKDFVLDICKPTVKDDRDLAFLEKYHSSLLIVATMHLGKNLSSFCHSNVEKISLTLTGSSFSAADLKIIAFILKNISEDRRAEVMDTLFKVQEMLSSNNSGRFRQYQFLNSNAKSINLQKVPGKLRPVLAQELLESLKTSYRIMSSTGAATFSSSFTSVIQKWFALNVLEPALETTLTEEDLNNRFMELFGLPLNDSPSIRVAVQKSNNPLCIFSDLASLPSIHAKDAFAQLSMTINKRLPKERGMGGESKMTGYISTRDEFIQTGGMFYSFDDILTIIELGVVEIDKRLSKLGREITPENRAAYLLLDTKERKFKNTWKYYDWGVTEGAKILALKKCKNLKKDDIQMFNSLPDEMFYELVEMESDASNALLERSH